ncbi:MULTISPECIES: MarR family winged helix-turn-helix transcriptional regulator [unclassified Paludibacterium]|uniref:MarR family winged helix-turn-helix transcriptional regulator n=1 Tax=unclassified Paludibacterium TaxID=2618429 RepID=UPI001C05E6CB|nr:MarR family transcriptional regulator [Paludibacterium sp. B53371]BEV70853.1 MarR family transcriptional regulator [Paludibacterium sp. THUN1379]
MLNRLGHHLAHIVNLKRRLLDQQLQTTGITRSQRQILLMLNQAGDCTQKHLLGQLDMDPGQLARTLEGLEKEGHITRRPWQANRRCLFVEMTAKCRETLMPTLLAAIDRVDGLLFAGFSEEEQALLQDMLSRMQHNLQHQAGDVDGL